MGSRFLKYLMVVCFLICVSGQISADEKPDKEAYHEFTLYIIPSPMPLDWQSPSSLYVSLKRSYLKTMSLSDNYLLGHVAVKLSSPLLSKPILVGQSSVSLEEKLDLILKQKIGFGIMGATLQGRLEHEYELHKKIEIYTKRNRLVFIRYRINEVAAKRMIEFIAQYSKRVNGKNAPCDFYGGCFWPRYENEGSGCSAFGVALLDLVNLLSSDTNEWRVDCNIPMNLIGGEYNQGKKVKSYQIKRANKWHNGEGEANVDYVKYRVYEPSVMYQWVLNKRNSPGNFICIEENNVPGLFIDMTHVDPQVNKPLFEQREEPNLFIDRYKRKIQYPEIGFN